MSTLRTHFNGLTLRYSPWQFAFFRILLGIYLTVHFASLIPYAREMFSNEGTVPHPQDQVTFSFFPNLLVLFDTTLGVQAFLGLCAMLAVLFTLGVKRRLISVLLWYGWACLFNRNLFIGNPGLAMVGWVLLAMSVIPAGEPLTRTRDPKWEFPKTVFFGGWLIAGIGYSLSGWHKWTASPSWHDGTAILQLLDNPLARETWWRDALLQSPLILIQIGTFLILWLEILYFPLIFLQATRKFAWYAIVLTHLGILLLMNFFDLTFGVLLFHFFIFDSRFLPAKKAGEPPILFFDGECGLCNRTVQFVLDEELENVFLFSPLSSGLASRALPQKLTSEVTTLAVKRGDRILTRSDAVLEIAACLGGVWRLAALLKVIPRFIRDSVYDAVARRRHRWFPGDQRCSLMSQDNQNRFLK